MNEEVIEEVSVEETEVKETKSGKVEFTKEQQEHIDKLISQQRSKAIEDYQKKQEFEKSEAKKLSKMNDDQKSKYELEKKDKQIAELLAKNERYEMEKVATNILNENNLPVNTEILDFVVRADAEKTQDAIKTLAALVNKTAEQLLKDRNKGETPTRGNSDVKEESWRKFMR